jgi:hypothetical protein
MSKVITILLIIVAAIHLIPVSGAIGPERLSILYGLSFDEANIAILMRHRAILFALLGVFFLCAAFNPGLQPLAFVAGFTSVASFIAISWSVGNYNSAIQKVVLADIVAFVCLSIALICYVIIRQKS